MSVLLRVGTVLYTYTVYTSHECIDHSRGKDSTLTTQETSGPPPLPTHAANMDRNNYLPTLHFQSLLSLVMQPTEYTEWQLPLSGMRVKSIKVRYTSPYSHLPLLNMYFFDAAPALLVKCPVCAELT